MFDNILLKRCIFFFPYHGSCQLLVKRYAPSNGQTAQEKYLISGNIALDKRCPYYFLCISYGYLIIYYVGHSTFIYQGYANTHVLQLDAAS